MNKKEITKRYNELLKEVETDDFYKNSLVNPVNCYVCKCGHITKTIDIDAGVTPFIHKCEKCCGLAKSTFYRDIIPNNKPTEEWYRPTLDQTLQIKNEGMLEHILQGGLDVRKIQEDKK